MPLYVVKCKNNKCENEFEIQCKVKELCNVTCPKCKSGCENVIVNPGHYKHLSWSTWRVDHNGS